MTTKKSHNCKFCDKEFSEGFQLGSHVRMCNKNPKHISRKIIVSEKASNRKLSKAEKKKISESMKKAHAENRAWNIGKSRWNNEPSWPEKFFKRVIENNIEDQEYIPEYNVGIYSIDFAWPLRKLAFEIDGEQHQRFEEYRNRDIRKDKFLQENGWKILRLIWKDVCNNPQQEIEKLIKFHA